MQRRSYGINKKKLEEKNDGCVLFASDLLECLESEEEFQDELKEQIDEQKDSEHSPKQSILKEELVSIEECEHEESNLCDKCTDELSRLEEIREKLEEDKYVVKDIDDVHYLLFLIDKKNKALKEVVAESGSLKAATIAQKALRDE